MAKRENGRRKKRRLPRDRQLFVDFMNFDFSVYRKMSVKTVPSMPLRLFLGRYELDSVAGHETAKQIQNELREVLFLKTPNGKRELGPLIEQARKYPPQTMLVASEDNEGIETSTLAPEDPRQHLYGVIIAAFPHGAFTSLQENCTNCGRIYWRKSVFCSLECGREYNTKTAAERMRRYRKTKGYKLKQRRKHGNQKS